MVFHPSNSALRIVVFFFVCVVATGATAQVFSPFQYGLGEAEEGTDVYRALLHTHQAADSCGGRVSYEGIDTLHLEIPPDARSIPLQRENDFGGVVLIVSNSTKGFFLFSHKLEAASIPVWDTLAVCRAIDSGDFRGIPSLGVGEWLLHVIDSTPWVDRREGYRYGHYREDIMTVRGGMSEDRPSMPYCEGGSQPSLFALRLDSISSVPFSFGNITFLRDSGSTCPTYLLDLEHLPQATLHDITVVTPHSEILAANDAIIRVYNCTNVLIDRVILWGSYSRLNHSGYGIVLNNLRNTHVRGLSSVSEWGIFGTNNMIETFIEHSDFNRFDIHCYGRDVAFEHCIQRNGYNQFSSVYGNISFHDCTFDNFIPVLIEDSYNAYSHFLLNIDSCRWQPTAGRNTIFKGGRIDSRLNSREELQMPALPDIDINHLEIDAAKGVKKVTLYELRGNERRAHVHSGVGRIHLHDITLSGNSKTRIILSTKRVKLLQGAKLEINDDIPRQMTVLRKGALLRVN